MGPSHNSFKLSLVPSISTTCLSSPHAQRMLTHRAHSATKWARRVSITLREKRETERRKWRDQRVKESRAGILANDGDVAAWVTARLFLPRAGLRRILNSLETVSSNFLRKKRMRAVIWYHPLRKGWYQITARKSTYSQLIRLMVVQDVRWFHDKGTLENLVHEV